MSTALLTEIDALAKHLASYSYPTSIESELQAAVEVVLQQGAFAFEGQVHLPKIGRLDLLVKLTSGAVALELKTKGGRTALLLQLARYAKSERVDALLIVTTASRLTSLPDMVMGKHVRAVRLPGAAF